MYYDFDSWIAAAQDLPTFRLLEEEDFESFDPSGFNSSTIHFNMFSVEINNPNITAVRVYIQNNTTITDLSLKKLQSFLCIIKSFFSMDIGI